jgi:uncharacterized protein (DUF58 family)
MIVPRNRLIFWVAAVGLPFSVLAQLYPPAMAVSAALLGLLALFAIVDILLAGRSVRGIRVELPPVTRLSRNRTGKIDIHIHADKPPRKPLRLALRMPPQVKAEQDEMLVTLPKTSEWSHISWPCFPATRGKFRVESAHIEGISPLGFWGARRRLPADSELRVYPNLMSERRELAALFTRQGLAGVHAQRQVGKGRDFEKLREYVAGDSYEDIHWKATARKGHPISKIFQIERTQELYVVIDSSRLSSREDTLERYVTSALLLGLAAERQGDHFGLISFSDKVGSFVRARNGKNHYSVCRDSVYALESRHVNPDFDEVCSFIRLRLRKRALVIFLTALDDQVLAENFTRAIQGVARQHLVFVNALQPSGAHPLFSEPNVTAVDDLYERLGGHMRWHSLQELGKTLKRRGIGFSLVDRENLSTHLVSQYLDIKKRQIL